MPCEGCTNTTMLLVVIKVFTFQITARPELAKEGGKAKP
jgi:hypothetical protein